MLLSQVMSREDWQLTQRIAAGYSIDPKLLVAIGWHETHWGRLGAGREGWHLGYGYYPGSLVKDKYRGLDNQLRGAAAQLYADMQNPAMPTADTILTFARQSWRPGDPDAWARSVWTIYSTLQDDYTPGPGQAASPVTVHVEGIQPDMYDSIKSAVPVVALGTILVLAVMGLVKISVEG